MSKLLALEAKLSILALNPCSCTNCREAAKLAKVELAKVSPLDLKLLGKPEFATAVQKFHDTETGRLQAAYNSITERGKCLLNQWKPSTITPIPVLPEPEEWRDKIEHYRKHAMKPRIEKMKNPRVPGSYTFK